MRLATNAINGVAFTDDAQIVSLTVEKTFAELAGVDVVIQPFTRDINGVAA